MKPRIKIQRHFAAALFSAFILSLMLSACVNIGGNNSTTPKYNTGYGFLTVDIKPIMPGNVIYIDSLQQNVNVLAQVYNDMYMPANNVQIKATNYNNNAISLDSFNSITDSQKTLQGYTQDYGARDMGVLQASVIARTVRNQPYAANINFFACADAKTLYSGTVCLAPADASQKYEKTCTPGSQSVTGGQGAPIAVTSIKTLDAASTVTFIITVVNKGNGLVYRKGTQDSCTYISQQDAGYLTMDYLKVGGKELTGCSNKEGRLNFEQAYQKNAAATFTCTVDRSMLNIGTTQSTVKESITAQFSYSYDEQLASQNILIKNAPGYTYSTDDYNNAIGRSGSAPGTYTGSGETPSSPTASVTADG